MFDVTKNQEIYEQFLQRFKQLHTETVTSFYIKYQTQTHRLITRGIWSEDDSNKFNELSFFRAKLNISQQLSLLLQLLTAFSSRLRSQLRQALLICVNCRKTCS